MIDIEINYENHYSVEVTLVKTDKRAKEVLELHHQPASIFP